MALPRNYERILFSCGFEQSGGDYYYPDTGTPHIHLSLISPQINGGRVDFINAKGSRWGRHIHYIRNGARINPSSRLNRVQPGFGDVASDIYRRLTP